jgi:hypothetical protein
LEGHAGYFVTTQPLLLLLASLVCGSAANRRSLVPSCQQTQVRALRVYRDSAALLLPASREQAGNGAAKHPLSLLLAQQLLACCRLVIIQQLPALDVAANMQSRQQESSMCILSK